MVPDVQSIASIEHFILLQHSALFYTSWCLKCHDFSGDSYNHYYRHFHLWKTRNQAQMMSKQTNIHTLKYTRLNTLAINKWIAFWVQTTCGKIFNCPWVTSSEYSRILHASNCFVLVRVVGTLGVRQENNLDGMPWCYNLFSHSQMNDIKWYIDKMSKHD